MKKLILITTLIVCVCAFAIMHTDDSDAAIVGSGTCGTDLNWEYDDATTTLTISGSGTTMDNYSEYSKPWYSYRFQITHIVLDCPNLNYIGAYAFATLPNAKLDTPIPDSVEIIGSGAFKGLSKIGITQLPSNLKTIGSYAFQSTKTGVTISTLPSGVTSLGEYCFYLSDVTFAELPVGITTIPTRCFADSKVAFTTLPTQLTSISIYAFDNCLNITSLTIPNGFNATFSTYGNCFDGCTNLKTIYNASNLNIVKGSDTYGGIAKYADVVLGGIPTASGTCGTNLNWAYVGDNTTLYIYGSGTSISGGRTAAWVSWHGYRSAMTDIVFDTPNLTTIGTYAFANCVNLTDFQLPDTLIAIDNHVFEDCANLVWTSLPDGVTIIGERAFSGCSNLALTSLPNNLTTIGKYAFAACFEISISSLPNGTLSVGEYALFNCWGITTLYIPPSITSIGNQAFAKCKGLQHIEYDIPNLTSTWSSGNFPFTDCTGIVEVTIGENVESLPNWLFYENSAVTSWTTINWNAINCADFSQDNMIFHNDKIHTIIFGDNVKHVPAYLTREFNDTLESVSFNDGLESIGDGAFQNSAIVVLGLPSTVKSVGVWSFSNCPNVMIRTLPTNMESIGSNAFANCTGITEMLIPVGFNATISDGAFANCTNLKTVLNLSDLNIEKGATTYGSIGAYADEVRNDIPSIGIVQQKDHIVHETIEKTDMASTLLRILPALMVIAILSFIVGALYYRSREMTE